MATQGQAAVQPPFYAGPIPMMGQMPQMMGQIPQMMGQMPQMMGQMPGMMGQMPGMMYGPYYPPMYPNCVRYY